MNHVHVHVHVRVHVHVSVHVHVQRTTALQAVFVFDTGMPSLIHCQFYNTVPLI